MAAMRALARTPRLFQTRIDPDRNNSPARRRGNSGRSARDRPRAEPGAEQRARKRQQREPDHFRFDQAAGGLQAQRGDSMVQLKVWKMPRRSSLPQPRTLAHRIGSGPDRPASPPRMPPANPIAASAGLPPNANAIGVAEIERGRKHQQQHADGQFEDLGIGMRDQQRAERHAEQAADHERPDQREIEARHIDGSVEIWATTEQISTSGTASDGGST